MSSHNSKYYVKSLKSNNVRSKNIMSMFSSKSKVVNTPDNIDEISDQNQRITASVVESLEETQDVHTIAEYLEHALDIELEGSSK